MSDWKLLEYFEDGHRELFNLKSDPFETTDVAEREPERVRELQTRLDAWRQEVGAKLPTTNPAFKAKKK